MNDSADNDRSRTQRKREAEELQAIGEKLLELPEGRLAALPIPEKLQEAILNGRRLTQRGALRRQRQYIGRLMRELDTEALEDAVQAMERQDAEENATFHSAERWRERLLGEGQAALEAFFDSHPGADRQRLRQLVAAAQKEARSNAPPRRQRELFRELRRSLEAGFEQDEDTGKMPG